MDAGGSSQSDITGLNPMSSNTYQSPGVAFPFVA